MKSSLAFATLDQLRAALDRKDISIRELVEYYHARFREHDDTLGSALELFDVESILATIEQSNQSIAGIPGLIKDNIAQKGRALTCASRILAGYQAVYDATAITRLKKAGAALIGRANMDEFAMGSSNVTSAYKKCLNPWDHTRVPGGSSGGSAAAVAAGLIPWALGSDTGGSVRQPAAFCGIVGLKPTYGKVSRYGLVAYASSLDQIGVFARTTKDVAQVFSYIAGHDTHDSSSLPGHALDYTQQLSGSLPAGLRIGVVDNALHAEGVDPEIRQALDTAIAQLSTLGAQISRVTIPTMDYSAAAYFIISRAEAASNLARFDGVRYGARVSGATLAQMYQNTRHDGFGREVQSRIMIGNYVLSAGHAGRYYQNAKKVQLMIRHEFDAAFKDVDLLLVPTHPVPAFKFGAYDVDPLQMDLQDYFTCPMNLAGIPAISVPCGMTKSGLPIGMQLVAPHNQEMLILQAAHAYEQATEWHTLHPKGY